MTWPLFAALPIVIASWAFVAYRRRMRVLPRVPRSSAPFSVAPLVSIILPARNEAASIDSCVRSLLAQDYPRLEIIAVDDCSDDATAAILRRLAAADSRLRVVAGSPVPADWMGKAHAIVQGYGIARGEWLLFTDADTHHAPWLLSGVMSRQRESSASFLTVVGSQRHTTRGVHLVNHAVFFGLWALVDPRGFQNPQSPASIVNGQYVMFARDTYEDIGTHAAVRHYSSTDLSLGYLAKHRGWKPLMLAALDGLETTMYRTPAEAWHGWSRSLVNAAWTYLGHTRGSLVLVGAVLAITLFWVTPWILGRYGLSHGNLVAALLAGLQFGAGLTAVRLVKGWRAALRSALLMPASCVILVAMVADGLLRAWRRGATSWKGRLVRTTARLPPWSQRLSRSG